MGLFSKTKRKSKPYQAWLCEDARFFGKLTAEEQVEFINENSSLKKQLKARQAEYDIMENVFNRQSEELKKLREAAGSEDFKNLAESALMRIEHLMVVEKESKLRLNMFDDVMSLFNTNTRNNSATGSYNIEHKLREFLNKE
jgi:hypothetical protein